MTWSAKSFNFETKGSCLIDSTNLTSYLSLLRLWKPETAAMFSLFETSDLFISAELRLHDQNNSC